MSSFFPMRRREAATLGFLIAFAAFAFIPAWRTTELWGMAVFGWLIAALMVVSPALALVMFLSGRDTRTAGGAQKEPSAPRDGEGVS
jgi:peptidoglycan/LPS O-acetylase OafA/YrhL